MHSIIESGLEDYLDGRSNQQFETHLESCHSCKAEVAAIQQVSEALINFRSEAPPDPSLGFHSRVMRKVGEREASSVWSVFRIDPGLARKLAFGSLLSLAALGGYLFTGTEDSMAKADRTPEAVIASHDTNSPNQQQHLDGMLLTLATYHQ